jgi:hypothetical protein
MARSAERLPARQRPRWTGARAFVYRPQPGVMCAYGLGRIQPGKCAGQWGGAVESGSAGYDSHPV